MIPELAKIRIVDDVYHERLSHAALILEVTPPADLAGDEPFYTFAVFKRAARLPSREAAERAAVQDLQVRSIAEQLVGVTS